MLSSILYIQGRGVGVGGDDLETGDAVPRRFEQCARRRIRADLPRATGGIGGSLRGLQERRRGWNYGRCCLDDRRGAVATRFGESPETVEKSDGVGSRAQRAIWKALEGTGVGAAGSGSREL